MQHRQAAMLPMNMLQSSRLVRVVKARNRIASRKSGTHLAGNSSGRRNDQTVFISTMKHLFDAMLSKPIRMLDFARIRHDAMRLCLSDASEHKRVRERPRLRAEETDGGNDDTYFLCDFATNGIVDTFRMLHKAGETGIEGVWKAGLAC